MNLRDEIDVVLSATIQQSDAVNSLLRAAGEGRERFDTGEVITMLADVLGAHRAAILRVAEEVDRLQSPDEA